MSINTQDDPYLESRQMAKTPMSFNDCVVMLVILVLSEQQFLFFYILLRNLTNGSKVVFD